jgi:hypothetical protein
MLSKRSWSEKAMYYVIPTLKWEDHVEIVKRSVGA